MILNSGFEAVIKAFWEIFLAQSFDKTTILLITFTLCWTNLKASVEKIQLEDEILEQSI